MRPRAVSPRLHALVRAAVLPLLAAALASAALAQQIPPTREFGPEPWKGALSLIKDNIRKNYYDPNFHGIDLDAHFKKAEEKMKQAESYGQFYGIVAQALLDFDDPHLYFLPPHRAARYNYGWRTQMVGDRCFVTAVRPGSDAEAKGLKPGDEVVSLDGYQPTRQNYWKMQYAYIFLRPAPGVRLVVAGPDGKERQLDVMTEVTQHKRAVGSGGSSPRSEVAVSNRPGGSINVPHQGYYGTDLGDYVQELEDEERERCGAGGSMSFGDDRVMLWKFGESARADRKIDAVMAEARKHKALVIDLRSNGCAAEHALLRVLANLFDRDVTVGEVKGRRESKPLTAKTRGGQNVYRGDLIVLVDSGSASASELFARAVQLEKRGTVMGDRTAGTVMRSRRHQQQSGMPVIVSYRVNVTDADIIMKDGKSLKHVGVKPDIVLLPKAADLAAGRDPVLSQAITLLGFPLDPEKAGALSPTKWKK
ncbi:MAG TPA: S41 family peptidase [Pyrinomonadaceae bacterium]|nr:S41 family peptidase [Pyrinomonadaceae bacterium]